MPISPELRASIEDDRKTFLLTFLNSQVAPPSAYFTRQELNIMRDRAHSELAVLLRKDLLGERETVATGGLPPRG